MNKILRRLETWREDRNIVELTQRVYKAGIFEELSRVDTKSL
jgi:hypothetical protein